MDVKEVIKELKEAREYSYIRVSKETLTFIVDVLENDVDERIKILQDENEKLREKQTPKKLDYFSYGSPVASCPSCKEFVAKWQAFCPYCGQALINEKE